MRTYVIAALLCLFQTLAAEPRHESLTLAGGEELSFEVYGRDGSDLRLLWIAPAFGLHQRHRAAAEALAAAGMEVWLVDLAEALFLPPGVAALRAVRAEPVGEAIHRLARRRDLVVVSSGYGAVPALRGIRAWQARADNGDDRLRGAILFSPALFARVPELGRPPDFLPVAGATSVPLVIVQAGRSATRWHLPALLSRLQPRAPVYVWPLPGVTALFYDEDRATETRAALARLPQMVRQATTLLGHHPVPRRALPLPAAAAAAADSGLDDRLRPYRGQVQPAPLALPDLDGRLHRLDDFRGRVTVLNFWATWCPPCVEEIPSLNRLRATFAGRPFALVSVNYAEPPERVRAFLDKVRVDFPVLLDADGRVAARWQVVAFPSTFVIGPEGRIRYGVNAAIAWDDPAVIRAIEALLPVSRR